MPGDERAPFGEKASLTDGMAASSAARARLARAGPARVKG